MKKYLYVEDFDVPLYRGRFVIIFTNSKKKIKKYLPKRDSSHIYAESWLGNYKGIEGFILVLNFDSKHRKIWHGIIAHEAVHIANYIVGVRGIKLDFDNDEPLSYLVEWLVDTVYKTMEKYDIKIA